MRAQRGFTYVGLLLAVALAGVALAAAGMLWSTTAKRDKEAELLFVGDQFRRAIARLRGTPGAKRTRAPRICSRTSASRTCGACDASSVR
jgi:type II secretory pathway pseudopilin PulG